MFAQLWTSQNLIKDAAREAQHFSLAAKTLSCNPYHHHASASQFLSLVISTSLNLHYIILFRKSFVDLVYILLNKIYGLLRRTGLVLLNSWPCNPSALQHNSYSLSFKSCSLLAWDFFFFSFLNIPLTFPVLVEFTINSFVCFLFTRLCWSQSKRSQLTDTKFGLKYKWLGEF